MVRKHNPLWEYCCHCYGHTPVKQTCLDWQERAGADVNLLLAAGWAAWRGQPLIPSLQAQLPAIRQWRQEIILPLRQARQPLSADGESGSEAPKSEARRSEGRLRNLILRLELLAEQIEIALIHAELSNPASKPMKTAADRVVERADAITLCNQNLLDSLAVSGHAHPIDSNEIKRLAEVLMSLPLPPATQP